MSRLMYLKALDIDNKNAEVLSGLAIVELNDGEKDNAYDLLKKTNQFAEKYDQETISTLVVEGYMNAALQTELDPDKYNKWDWFKDGVYLGPEKDFGLEPIFSPRKINLDI